MVPLSHSHPARVPVNHEDSWNLPRLPALDSLRSDPETSVPNTLWRWSLIATEGEARSTDSEEDRTLASHPSGTPTSP